MRSGAERALWCRRPAGHHRKLVKEELIPASHYEVESLVKSREGELSQKLKKLSKILFEEVNVWKIKNKSVTDFRISPLKGSEVNITVCCLSHMFQMFYIHSLGVW